MTLESAQKAAERFFTKNNYHHTDHCCANCQFSEAGYEGEYSCQLAEGKQNEWYVGDIAPYGVCDRYKEEK